MYRRLHGTIMFAALNWCIYLHKFFHICFSWKVDVYVSYNFSWGEQKSVQSFMLPCHSFPCLNLTIMGGRTAISDHGIFLCITIAEWTRSADFVFWLVTCIFRQEYSCLLMSMVLHMAWTMFLVTAKELLHAWKGKQPAATCICSRGQRIDQTAVCRKTLGLATAIPFEIKQLCCF